MSSTRLLALLLAGGLAAAADAVAQQPVVPNAGATAASGCDKSGNQWFRDRGFFDPLIADIRAPQIAFSYPAVAPEMPHSDQTGNRVVWDVSVGRELPIFTRANFTDATKGAGCSGWGVWADVSFHLLEDFKDDSNPIVNADYRFSLAKLKYYRVLSKGAKKVRLGESGAEVEMPTYKTLGIRFDAFHHESTHLGDEYVILAQGLTEAELAERGRRPFERFNVSYEFFDIGGAFNWEGPFGEFTTIRGGTTGLLKPGKGYYSDHTLEPDQRDVVKSERNFEPYVQFEHHRPHTVQTPSDNMPMLDRFKPFVSIDARHRIVLDFYKASQEQLEERQWSFNVLGGVRSWTGQGRFSIKEIYLRFYHGVNPNGQLRSERDYWQLGLGVNIATGDR